MAEQSISAGHPSRATKPPSKLYNTLIFLLLCLLGPCAGPEFVHEVSEDEVSLDLESEDPTG